VTTLGPPEALELPEATGPADLGETPLLVIVGPTASGKTELALRLAELSGGEVVSADSVQVYRRFDIGSGKPTLEDRARAPQHLLDVVEPHAAFEVARFVERADDALRFITARGRRPIVCGGTFLWVRALLYGLAEAPPADDERRAEHQRIAEAEGREALHARLSRVDPECAARLHPNDLVRVSRALEVFELTGQKLSALQAAHGFAKPRYGARLIGIAHDREAQDARIRARCAAMFRSGWVDEVRELARRGYGTSRAMGAVGYKHIHEALQKSDALDSAALATLEDEVYRATRVFARRQRTWLREEPVTWLAPEELGDEALRTLLL
jgi:tRNA dimethylallyltransferase